MTRAHRLKSRLAARALPFRLFAVNEVIQVTEGGKVKRITKRRALIKAKLAARLGRPLGLPLWPFRHRVC